MENAHWILSVAKDEKTQTFYSSFFKCSSCGKVNATTRGRFPDNQPYCYHCGAHMIENPTIEIRISSDEDFLWEE